MKVFLLILAMLEAVVIISLVVSRTKKQKQLKMIMDYAYKISKKDLNVADLQVNGDRNLTALAGYINRIKKNFVSFIESTRENLTVLSDVVDVMTHSTGEAASAELAINESVDSLENLLVNINGVLRQFSNELQPVEGTPKKRLKIAFFSKLDNYFWYNIKSGVNYAQKVLADKDVDVVYFPYVTMIDEHQFPGDVQSCIDEQFDAIIFPGFLRGADDLLQKAIQQGIEVFAYNCDCDPSVHRVCCYAPNESEAGVYAAKELQKLVGEKGNIAIMLGEPIISINIERYESFSNYIREHCKGIRIVDTFEVYNRPEETYEKIVNCLKNHPDIKAIYNTTGMQLQLAQAIVDTGNEGKIKAVVFDHNDQIFDYIKKGVIGAAISFEPFNQGYEPIILMYNHLVTGQPFEASQITCKSNIVTEENVDYLVKI